MDKICKMLAEVTDECERKGVPFLAVAGTKEIEFFEHAPENTPERIIKARTTLLNVTNGVRRQMRIIG